MGVEPRYTATLAAALFVWSGLCVAQLPKIDTSKYSAPKSVLLVDVPRMPALALIGVITIYQPGPNQWHFHERSDRFFELPGKPLAPGEVPPGTLTGPVPAQGGLIGSMIMNSGAETQRLATGFDAEVLKRHPDFDLSGDFMKALRAALEAKGIAVTVAGEGRASYPRLRWPAKETNGTVWPAGALESSPAVDADLLVQVSLIAFYNSHGPLNAYHRNVTVTVALYDGRSRQFLGREMVRFRAPDSRFEYSRYDALVQDLPVAAPALRDALVSLAAPVAELIDGKSPRN